MIRAHARLRRPSAIVAVVLMLSALNGCGSTLHRGIQLGQLREQARRVEGGGVECPLALEPSVIRPSAVADSAPVLPYRTDGSSSDGIIGKGLSSPDSVQLSCAFAVGGLRVGLVVLGVPHGHALAGFAGMLRFLTDETTAMSFIDANAQVRVDRAVNVPGAENSAFVRVASARGDIAMMLTISKVDADATARVPGAAEVAAQAERIAKKLAG